MKHPASARVKQPTSTRDTPFFYFREIPTPNRERPHFCVCCTFFRQFPSETHVPSDTPTCPTSDVLSEGDTFALKSPSDFGSNPNSACDTRSLLKFRETPLQSEETFKPASTYDDVWCFCLYDDVWCNYFWCRTFVVKYHFKSYPHVHMMLSLSRCPFTSHDQYA